MSHTPIEAKIAALMAKADATDSPEEAAAFYAKAEELMLKHTIDRADLPSGEVKDKLQEIVTMTVPYIGAKQRWRALGIQGAAVIADATGLAGVAIRNREQEIILYGAEADCRHVRTLITAAWRQAEASLAVWRKTSPIYKEAYQWSVRTDTGYEYHRVINGYVYGFCVGAASRIRETRQAVVEQTVGAEVALIDTMDRVNESLGKLRKSRNRVTGMAHDAHSEGFTRGRTANLVDELG